jgi:hypothetical protein
MRTSRVSLASMAAAFALATIAAPASADQPAASTLVHVTGCSTRHAGAGAEATYVGPGPVAGMASNSSFATVYGDDYYQPIPGASSPVMLVSFTNISGRPMTMIEFGLLSNEILSGGQGQARHLAQSDPSGRLEVRALTHHLRRRQHLAQSAPAAPRQRVLQQQVSAEAAVVL